mmetsp:Transcript_119073/g.237454  ORF Transcript_119073/g.237454 Transcript_119073/m.237454 type:complete len:229 (+) Transcript_119073:595-1281(+)
MNAFSRLRPPSPSEFLILLRNLSINLGSRGFFRRGEACGCSCPSDTCKYVSTLPLNSGLLPGMVWRPSSSRPFTGVTFWHASSIFHAAPLARKSSTSSRSAASSCCTVARFFWNSSTNISTSMLPLRKPTISLMSTVWEPSASIKENRAVICGSDSTDGGIFSVRRRALRSSSSDKCPELSRSQRLKRTSSCLAPGPVYAAPRIADRTLSRVAWSKMELPSNFVSFLA